MSEDKLDFLNADPSDGKAVDQGADEPQRGSDGRFLTAVPVTNAPHAKASGDGSEAGRSSGDARLHEDGRVPISALLDEREKRQAERTQREALERQVADMRAQATPQRELAPTEQLEIALYSQNLRASRRFAEREYGKETVASLHDWATRRCDDDPVFNQQMRLSDDPYEAAFQAYHREQILQTVRPNDLAAFKAWQAAQAAADDQTATHLRQRGGHLSTSARSVPRSLATASGTGGAGAPHTPIGPGLAFANAINR